MCSQSFWLARNDAPEAVHAAPLLGRERVGVGRVDRRQVRVASAGSGRRRPRWCPPAWSMRWSSRRWSISHCGLRAITCPSSLNCMTAAAFCIRATSRSGRRPLALGHEAGRGVVGVDGAGQVLQRRERDAVPLVELAEPAVAERDAEDVADQGLVAEAGAEPGGVVVAPDERDVGLLAEVVDDAVAPRARGPSSRRR